MTKGRLLQYFTMLFYLVLGILIGLIVDKEWISVQELDYITKLKAENHLLQEEKVAWISYLKDELKQYRFYTSANNEQFHDLGNVLSNIGITLEKLPEQMLEMPHRGIVISLGEELEETYGLPQLKLDTIPLHDIDMNVMYLSLLKIKEEFLQ